MNIRETANNFINTSVTGLGLKARKYRVEQGRGRNGLTLSVFDGNRLISTEGPYSSEFDCGLDIGRKRLWGRLEYITGNLMELGGAIGLYNPTLDISNPEGVRLLLIFGAIGVGGILFKDGKKRKDIATVIINRLSHSATSNR